MVVGNAEANSNKDDLEDALKEGRLTRAELCRNAGNILRFLLKTPAYQHMLGKESELDKELKNAVSEEDILLQQMIKVKTSGDDVTKDLEDFFKRGVTNLE